MSHALCACMPCGPHFYEEQKAVWLFLMMDSKHLKGKANLVQQNILI